MPFNHSRLNNLAATQAYGDLLLLLNDDTEVITPEWLTALAEQALRPEVGAAGGWLFHPDDRIQHAGVVVGLGAVATPLHTGITCDGLDRGVVRLIRNVSAVTGACLMIRRRLYLEMGGLDAEALPTSFNDVDLCLRLRKAGYRIIYTPLAQLYHHESASRNLHGEERFIQTMRERWGDELKHDPFWNPNLPSGEQPPGGFAFHWHEPSYLAASANASRAA
jgi:GT2 family glycosyltransferase